MTLLPDIYCLWEKSYGDPRVSIAILDGPVDQAHTCFQGAKLTQLKTLAAKKLERNLASQHGTHVTSVIFGQRNSAVPGIAPLCKGLIVPIFTSSQSEFLPCSQLDLARAIIQAVEQGANVINISGGQFSQSSEPDQLLANAVQLCVDKNVLIVAAAGNDGCNCLHIPAAIPSVLAVGAMDLKGNPIDFSNWGEAYQTNGILAPGENILGAVPDGGVALKTGTSFATPVVSGIVALLLSIQLAQGDKPDPQAIRDAILNSALPCNLEEANDCRRFLAGILNIPGVQTLIVNGGKKQMPDSELHELEVQPNNEISNNTVQEIPSQEQDTEIFQPIANSNFAQVKASTKQPIYSTQFSTTNPEITSTSTTMPTALNDISTMSTNGVALSAKSNQVFPSEGCGCEGGGTMQLVYALGELGYDFGTEARRDSIQQAMGLARPPLSEELLEYIANNPWEAQSITWTLNLDATPIYVIAPTGAFANVAYERLCSFLSDENIERVSIPGRTIGNVRLMSGQVVPAIVPEVRGMHSWSTEALLNILVADGTGEVTQDELQNTIREVLDRIYYDFRNLGMTPQERALNYAATNAFQLSLAISRASLIDQVLDTVSVEKSPICRPGADCYDVKIRFFDPENSLRAKKIQRFTVDVSDVIPVTVGRIRSWSES